VASGNTTNRKHRLDQEALRKALPHLARLEKVVLTNCFVNSTPRNEGDEIPESPTHRQWKAQRDRVPFPPYNIWSPGGKNLRDVGYKYSSVPTDPPVPFTQQDLMNFTDLNYRGFERASGGGGPQVATHGLLRTRYTSASPGWSAKPWPTAETPFRGLIILLRSLVASKKELQEFVVEPCYNLRLMEWNNPGISYWFFFAWHPDLQRMQHIFQNLRKLQLVIGSSVVSDQHFEERTARSGNIGKVISQMPQLSDLTLEWLSVRVVELISRDTIYPKLKSVEFCGHIYTEGMVNFLRRHRGLDNLRIVRSYIFDEYAFSEAE
jgi:hypothetical protein